MQIRYSGIDLASDELAAENGTLEVCAGVEEHGSALRPSVLRGTELGKLVMRVGSDGKPSASGAEVVTELVYEHVTGDYCHLICVYGIGSDTHVCYFNMVDGRLSGSGYIAKLSSAKCKFVHTGNTLMSVNADRIVYYIWKYDKYVVQDVIEESLGVKFGVMVENVQPGCDFGSSASGSVNPNFKYKMKASILRPDVNKKHPYDLTEYPQGLWEAARYVAYDERENRGTVDVEGSLEDISQFLVGARDAVAKFWAENKILTSPRFIRCAIKDYQGNTIYCGPLVQTPVNVNEKLAATLCYVNYENDLDNPPHDEHGKPITLAKNGSLYRWYYRPGSDYTITLDNANEFLDRLKTYKESGVIGSVEFYLSAGTYGTEEECKFDTKPILSFNCGIFDENGRYGIRDIDDISLGLTTYNDAFYLGDFWDDNSFQTNRYAVKNASIWTYNVVRKKKSYAAEVKKDAAILYKFLTLYPEKTEEYRSQIKDGKLDLLAMSADGVLLPEVLVTQPTLVNSDAKEPELPYRMGAESAFVFNNRLDIYNVHKKLTQLWSPREMFIPSTDVDGSNMVREYVDVTDIVFDFKTSAGRQSVRNSCSPAVRVPLHWLKNVPIYLNSSEVETVRIYGTTQRGTVPLAFGHYEFAMGSVLDSDSLLMGKWHIGDFSTSDTAPTLKFDYMGIDESEIRGVLTNEPNTIYQSEVADPFVFPVKKVVGTGGIMAVATTTVALSEGQYGKFPLMLFCTDGLWTININTDGTLGETQPLSREVITNEKSLVSLDQSVLFTTAKGISQVYSNKSENITGKLDGVQKELSRLPKLMEIMTQVFAPNSALEDPAAELLGTVAALDELKECVGIYDQANIRVLYFQAQGEKFYVLNAVTGGWSTMQSESQWLTGLNGYPYPYLEAMDGTLMRLDKTYDYSDDEKHNGMVVTRALKPGVLIGAINELQQEHTIEGERPMLVLWGSNNLRDWHYIGKTNAPKMGSLPGRTFRYFKAAVLMRLTQGEVYMGTQLAVTQKWGKL